MELIGKELKAVPLSKRQRQLGSWLFTCFRPSQHGCDGVGAMPWTNGMHGTNGSRRGPQFEMVGPGGEVPPGF